MKRVTFKKEFRDIHEVRTKVPNQLKEDKNIFEMTDGNKTFKVRWEGSLTEGNAVILQSKDDKLVSEDVSRMKRLMGYKPENTIGSHSTKTRITENNKFKELIGTSKTKKLVVENDGSIDLKEEDVLKEGMIKNIAAGLAMLATSLMSGQITPEEKVEQIKSSYEVLSPEEKEEATEQLSDEQYDTLVKNTDIPFTRDGANSIFAPPPPPFEAPDIELGAYGEHGYIKYLGSYKDDVTGEVYHKIGIEHNRRGQFQTIKEFLEANNSGKGGIIKFVDMGRGNSPIPNNDISLS